MTAPWQITPRLAPDTMARVRRRAIFECCKWDPQVEDTSVLSPFALLLPAQAWRQLSAWAEILYAETLAAERQIVGRAELLRDLGLPAAIAHLLTETTAGSAPPGLRVMRFDFHHTTEGWRISEVNSDVPGGYIESAGFTRLMAEQFSGYQPTADPVAALVHGLVRDTRQPGLIALVHATAYTDDRQVMVYLQRAFRRAGCEVELASPADITWRHGVAHLGDNPCSALLRFFPGEWLPNLPGRQWENFFRPTQTLQLNPGAALISQSKRFPLTWPRLDQPPQLWEKLLPETLDPGRLADQALPDWVLKPALGRVGDGIGLSGITPKQEHAKILQACRRQPKHWAAQRRFDSVAGDSAVGPLHACFGVYVIGGRSSGIYGRIASDPLINHQAQDVAVLIPDAGKIAVGELQLA